MKGDLKIGVFGIGINLSGLVPKKLYGDIEVLHAYEVAERTATLLKKDEKCDLVICLSHLGYQYELKNYFSDVKMAANTRNIDVIIGGHTHTFLKKAQQIRDKDGELVIVNQAGWAGIMLGRIDVTFEKGKKKKCYSCKNEYLQNAVDNSIIKYK
jgi:5'-nucleotidase